MHCGGCLKLFTKNSKPMPCPSCAKFYHSSSCWKTHKCGEPLPSIAQSSQASATVSSAPVRPRSFSVKRLAADITNFDDLDSDDDSLESPLHPTVIRNSPTSTGTSSLPDQSSFLSAFAQSLEILSSHTQPPANLPTPISNPSTALQHTHTGAISASVRPPQKKQKKNAVPKSKEAIENELLKREINAASAKITSLERELKTYVETCSILSERIKFFENQHTQQLQERYFPQTHPTQPSPPTPTSTTSVDQQGSCASDSPPSSAHSATVPQPGNLPPQQGSQADRTHSAPSPTPTSSAQTDSVNDTPIPKGNQAASSQSAFNAPQQPNITTPTTQAGSPSPDCPEVSSCPCSPHITSLKSQIDVINQQLTFLTTVVNHLHFSPSASAPGTSTNESAAPVNESRDTSSQTKAPYQSTQRRFILPTPVFSRPPAWLPGCAPPPSSRPPAWLPGCAPTQQSLPRRSRSWRTRDNTRHTNSNGSIPPRANVDSPPADLIDLN